MNPNSLYEAAEDLLGLVNTVYTEYAETVAPLPSRQILVAGTPSSQPHDCEQVVIYISQMYPGEPGNQDWNLDACHGLRTAAFMVEIVRKTSPINETVSRRTVNPSVLTVAQENDIAKTQFQDIRMLFEIGERSKDAVFVMQASTNVLAGSESGLYQAQTLQLEGMVP